MAIGGKQVTITGGKITTNGTLGSCNGKGSGTNSHITDAPSTVFKDVKFENWAVCVKGKNAGEFLAGIKWGLDKNGKAVITDKKTVKPSEQFKNAVKGWIKWYNQGKPATGQFKEPGKGFQWP